MNSLVSIRNKKLKTFKDMTQNIIHGIVLKHMPNLTDVSKRHTVNIVNHFHLIIETGQSCLFLNIGEKLMVEGPD